MKKAIEFLITLCGISGFVNVAYGQCTGETATIVNKCVGQQAQVSITAPAPVSNVTYHWYDPSPFLELGRGYGVTYPAPLPAGGQTITYQKEVSTTGGPTALPGPYSAPGEVPSSSDPYSMTINSSLGFRLNAITVSIHTYSCQPTDVYRLKIKINTTYSQWFTFKCSDMIATSNGSVKLVRVPVNTSSSVSGITVPSGASTITILTAADGTEPAGTKVVDAFDWFNTASFTSTYTINSAVTLNYGAASATIAGQTNKVPGLFDWDITTLCTPVAVPITPSAVGCCVPANVNAPVITSSTGTNIINTDPVAPAITLTTPLQSGYYYQWLKDGVALGGAFQGNNVNSISVTNSGQYTVNVVQNVADISKVSCVKNSLMWVQKRILFAQADKTTICLGETVNLLAKGATGPTSWSPSTNMTAANTVTPTFTPITTGKFPLTVTGEVPVGNQIINGDFEQGNVAINPSSYYTFINGSTATNSTPAYALGYPARKALSISPGNYTIGPYVYWPGFQAWLPGEDHTTGTGNFLYTDASASGTAGPTRYLWSQNVVVQPNTNYEFAAWIMNINAEADGAYVAPTGVTGITPNPASNPLPLIMLYINDVPAFAGPPTLLQTVDLWQKVSTTWNSGSTTGAVSLKLAEIFAGSGTAGHDFGLDDISFGAPGNQTDTISVMVNDCNLITAISSVCAGDSVTITASTNGVFQNWKNTTTGTPSTVNIKNPNSISTKVKSVSGVSTKFTATAKFIFGNEIVNGDFSAYNSGFSTTYTDANVGSSMNPGQFKVGIFPATIDPATLVNKNDHTTGSATASYYVGDSRYDATRNVAYRTSVSVVNGTEYGFSGWFANVSKEFLLASPDTFNTAPYPSGAKDTRLDLYINNQFVQRILLPLDTAWHNYAASWIANVTGNVNIELRSVNVTFGSVRSGFAMDDLKFGQTFTATKNVDVLTTPCALPIELLSFSVFKINNGALLKWQTATEQNSDYFIIEKSTDGITFKEAGRVKAAGNSNAILSYSFTDEAFISGTVYYRLKEIDFDGLYTYSNTQQLRQSGSGFATLFPNPSDQSFNLIISAGSVKANLKTVTGSFIAEIKLEENGTASFGNELASGIYILELRSEDSVEFIKLIKQ